jgi:demethylmenaquinone methyltransferase/2-methoxy-6-polyprenyl-1,4-benzoquinol methylase
MAESYYVSGPERGVKVRELFDRIANRYDLINDLQSFGLHRFWKAELIRIARVKRGETALDVCAGTGDIAIRLAGKGARVTGCDFSEAMLQRARERSPALEWVAADALALPFAANSFDLVTMGYGLRNLADFELGIREMMRVARPGGRLLILEFAKPRNRLWRWIYFGYLRMLVPLLGLLCCGDLAAYLYILESLHRYPGQEGIERLLRENQSRNVRTRNFLGGVMSIHYAEK